MSRSPIMGGPGMADIIAAAFIVGGFALIGVVVGALAKV
jgi:hypothetical protein